MKNDKEIASRLVGIRQHLEIVNLNLIAAKITTSPTDRAYYFRTAITRIALAKVLADAADAIAAKIQRKMKGGRQ